MDSWSFCFRSVFENVIFNLKSLEESLMKVLWFSNTPANSDEHFNTQLSGTGGWLKSLDKAIQEKVDLHVAFYHNKDIDSFRYGNATYHPIKKHKNLFGKSRSRLFNEIIDTEHLDIYLNLINRIKPDIIDIHGTENPFGAIITKTEIPVITTIQGNITVYLYKFCHGIERKYLNVKNMDVFNIKSLILPAAFKNSRNRFVKMQRREEKNLNPCKYIIGRTSWDKRISRILAPGRIYFHNDRIFRDSFYLAKWNPNNNKNLILHTTSGNTFYKGFETLCLALYELNKLGIDCEWRVAGIKGEDLIVKVVKKKLGEKFPKKNLTLLGSLTENLLVERLLEADIYVMPSHIENSPNNLCEAMILGMPCIATFAGGTGSLLKDGEEGILIQDGDPWVMAGAVLEIKDNYDNAVVMGQNARKRAIIRHDREKISNGLVEIYSEILSIHESKILKKAGHHGQQ
jgi:glycosyltransferase involved in cell wall biosynthesis